MVLMEAVFVMVMIAKDFEWVIFHIWGKRKTEKQL